MYKLIRNNQEQIFDTKPYVFGALDYRLYEWMPRHGWVQIGGRI